MKILVRLPNWLGDVVMSTGFFNALKLQYPDAQIDIIIKKELEDLAKLIPGWRKIYPFSKKDHKGLAGAYRFGKLLRVEKYDLYFNLPSSLSSITMAWASKAKKRIGFGAEGGAIMLSHSLKKPKGGHRVDEYISLLESFTGNKCEQKRVYLNAGIDGTISHKKLVLVNFNSEATSRKMPVEKGQKILNSLTNTFSEITFGLIGSKKETAFVESIIEGADNINRIENYAGKTGLLSLAKLMAESKVLLSTDSGPAHLANGLNVPVVVLFGAGNEHNTAPYNAENLQIIRGGKLACEPCLKNECKLYGIPKCMELIDELTIINAIGIYLKYA